MRIIQASAPGSMMLLGEHAVVRGGLGVAVSLAARVYVRLTPRADRLIHISSDRFAALSCSLDHLPDETTHAYAIGTLRYLQSQLTQGYDIHIHSELSPTHGFGSSAALVVALLAGLYAALNPAPVSPLVIAASARAVIINVQGRGSGCDAYTSALGGTVAIHQPSAFGTVQQGLNTELQLSSDGIAVQRLSVLPPLTAVYTGYKTKTAIVLAEIAAKEAKMPSHYAALFEQINVQTATGLGHLQTNDWPALGQSMRAQFELQQALGIADATTLSIMHILNAQHAQTGQPWGAKISGSGLGDCVIALGTLPSQLFPHAQLPATQQFALQLGLEGVRVSVDTTKVRECEYDNNA